MTLQFYNVSDDPRKMQKTLGSVIATVTNVFLKERTDMLRPTFILTGVDAGSGWNNRNYLYCTEFGRYYFITGYQELYGGKTAVSCEVDVLMTYGDQILNSDVIVFNQTKKEMADGLISDTRLPMQVNTESRTFKFQKGELQQVGSQNWSYVLSCFGGGN